MSHIKKLRGTSNEIYGWLSGLPKDEEYANILDEVVEEIRQGLSLNNVWEE